MSDMDKTLQKIDGRYLKYMRKKQGLSLRALAEEVYVSKSSVQRWESSSVPENPDVLEKLSQVFGVTVEEMRMQSAEMFGEESTLTPDERAEVKFGIMGLGKIIGGVAVAIVVVIVILILFLA